MIWPFYNVEAILMSRSREPRLMRVLIAEDDWLHAEALSRATLGAGHVVLGPAASVEEALDLVEADLPDFALVDIYLANASSGLALCESLWHLWRVPSLLVTGYDIGFEFTDAVGRLMKPFESNAVGAALEFFLQRTPAGPGTVPDGLQITPAGHRRLAI